MVGDQQDRYLRHPVRDGGGGVFFLSEREKFICDVLLQTGGNMAAAAKACREKFHRPMDAGTVKRWMLRKHQVKDYIHKRVGELVDYQGMTKEVYFQKIYTLAAGDVKVNRSTPLFWKMIGVMKGFLADGEAGNNMAVQINFTQADGSR